MSDITIDGQVYKEVPIRHLIVDGKAQEGLVITAKQLLGKTTINVSIEAELPNDTQNTPTNEPTP